MSQQPADKLLLSPEEIRAIPFYKLTPDEALPYSILKAQLAKATPLIEKQERERIKLYALQAIADEPEYPGDMPDELWKELNDNRINVLNAMRGTVRLTKDGITERFLLTLKGGGIK